MATQAATLSLVFGSLIWASLMSSTYGSSEPEERITNGAVVPDPYYPSVGMAFLEMVVPNDTLMFVPICTVTLVGPQTALTSCRCITSAITYANGSTLSVTKKIQIAFGMKSSGVADMMDPSVYMSQNLSMADVTCNPSYKIKNNTVTNTTYYEQDIAFVKLMTPLDSSFVPMPLQKDVNQKEFAPQYLVSWGQPNCVGLEEVVQRYAMSKYINIDFIPNPPNRARDQFYTNLSMPGNPMMPSKAAMADAGAPIISEQLTGPDGAVQCVIRGILGVQKKMPTMTDMDPIEIGIGCSESSLVLANSVREANNLKWEMAYENQMDAGIMFTTIYSEMTMK